MELVRGKPLEPLAFLPLALALLSGFHVNHYSVSVLLVVLPAAYVLLSIRPLVSAFAVFYAVFKIADVSLSISPNFDSFSLHVAVSELALISLLDVSKKILSVPFELAIHEVSLIVRAILPLKFSFAVFLSRVEGARILGCTLVPALLTVAVLNVVKPLTSVHSSRSISKNTDSACLIVLPEAFIDVAVSMGHSAISVGHVVSPHAFVLGTIAPKLDTNAILCVRGFEPLAFVLAAF